MPTGVWPRPPLRDRFWSRVRVRGANDCWEWQGHVNRQGYGGIGVVGRSHKVHRVAWLLAYGSIPDGLCVLHHCDNPPCVNVRHLWLGTNRDNLNDMRAKGRWARTHPLNGTLNHNAKLHPEAIREIRRQHGEVGDSLSAIARCYGVALQTISRIINGRTWRHVD